MFVPLLAFPQDFWLEAECATVGANWQVVASASSSQGSYLATPVGNFSAAASADPANSAVFQFNVSQPGNYAVFARVIAPTANDDSYWVRANGGSWVRWNLIQASTTFTWDQVHNDLNNSLPVLFALQAGMNTIEFGIRENGTSLDKIYVTLSGSTPSGIGNTASNCSGGAPLNISALPTQFHDEGDAVSLQVAAAGGDSTLHFSATGLPPGLVINNLSGEIAGVIAQGAQAGSAYFPVITVDDSDGTSLDAISTTFKWVIFEAGTGFTNNWIYLEPQISPKHIQRHENSFVQAGDRFYLFGGRESPRVVEEFNYTTKSWSNANILAPKDFNHFQPITYEGLVWLFCAFQNNSFPNETPVDSVFVMDPAGKRWISWTSIPAARRRGSAGTVEYQGKFYIVCGNTIGHNGGYVNWFDRYDPATNTWTVLPNAPRARDHFQSAVIGNKMYLSGGRLSGGPGGTFAPTIPEIDVYDFTTGTWSTLPASSNLPTQRAGNASVNFKGQLIVIGGEANGQAWNSVEMMDPASGTWETLTPLNFARHGTQAVVAGDGIYITSGSPVQGGGKMTNMEVFSQDNPGTADPIDPSQLFALSTLSFPPTPPGDTSFATLRIWAANGNQGIMIKGISVQGASAVQATTSMSFPRLLKANDTLEIVYRYLPTNSNGLSGQIVIQQGPFGSNVLVPLSIQTGAPVPIVLPAIANRSNTVGDVVSFQVPASGGDGALVFSANGLPAGLIISSSGLISGTVLASALATNPVTITVDDSDGITSDKKTATFTWTISPLPVPIVLPAIANRSNTVGNVVSFQVPASGGDGALVFSANGLPAGLSISSSGLISGTVLASALPSNLVTITVDDSDGITSDKQTATFTWTISSLPVPIVLPAIANRSNTVGDVVSFQVPASGGDGALVFSANGLPAGLSISSSGLISGTVLASALASNLVTITVDDSDGITSDKQTATFTWTISPLPVPIVLPAIANRSNIVGDVVSFQVPASGGDGTLVFSANGLPAGLSISGSGLITGTVLASALPSNLVTITVDDSDGITSDKKTTSFTWQIDSPPAPVFNEIWLEAECGVVGSNWSQHQSAMASNGLYVTSPNTNFNNTPSPLAANQISYPFTVWTAGVYYLFGRVLVPNGNDDSFWVRIDGGNWIRWNDLPLSPQFQWVHVFNNLSGNAQVSFALSGGNHVLEVAGRESGASVDKWFLSQQNLAPIEEGGTATNCGTLSVPIQAQAVASQTNTEGDNVLLPLTISGGDGPITVTASGLPGGLAVAGTIIAGTLNAGTASQTPYQVILTIDDADSDPTDKIVLSFSWTVLPAPVPLSLDLVSDQDNNEGDTVSIQLSASGGEGALQFFASGLPAGLTLNPASGEISGVIATGAANGSPYPTLLWVDDSDGDQTDTAQVSFVWNVHEVIVPLVTDLWLEAECSVLGGNWSIVSSTLASGGQYALAPTTDYLGAASADPANHLRFQVTVNQTATYHLFGRVLSPGGNDNSFWVRVNGGAWIKWNEIAGSASFAWDHLHNNNLGNVEVQVTLQAGNNEIIFAGRENGTGLDKLYLTTGTAVPAGLGGTAPGCEPVQPSVPILITGIPGQTNEEGNFVSLQVQASGGDGALVFSASGLPPGLSISGSGLIQGVIGGATNSPYLVTITADDSDGDLSDLQSILFAWTVELPVSEAWLEAECGDIGSAWTILPSPDASGGFYLKAPEQTFNNAPSTAAANLATFEANISTAGQYRLIGRVLAANSNDDSFWVRMNGGTWVRWNNIQLSNTFIWDEVHEDRTGNTVVVFTLSPGIQTIELAGRETGTLIDKLFLTSEPGIPSGLGEEAGNCEAVTSNAAEHGGNGAGLPFGGTWEVFPNPVPSGAMNFTIQFPVPVSGLHTLSLSDLQGRTIGTEQTHWLQQQQVLRVEMSEPLAAGLYLIQLNDASGSTVKRILVQAGL